MRSLAEQRDAVILAHNYQSPEVQDLAHHVGYSLALSRLAAASTSKVIVFAGVHFMAETAKTIVEASLDAAMRERARESPTW